MLEREGFEVVGEAVDGASGIALARAAGPDLVLLDVVLPDLSGFDVADELDGGVSKIVLVSSRSRVDFGPRLLRSPVVGSSARTSFPRNGSGSCSRKPHEGALPRARPAGVALAVLAYEVEVDSLNTGTRGPSPRWRRGCRSWSAAWSPGPAAPRTASGR